MFYNNILLCGGTLSNYYELYLLLRYGLSTCIISNSFRLSKQQFQSELHRFQHRPFLLKSLKQKLNLNSTLLQELKYSDMHKEASSSSPQSYNRTQPPQILFATLGENDTPTTKR